MLIYPMVGSRDYYSYEDMPYIVHGSRMSNVLGLAAEKAPGITCIISTFNFLTMQNVGSRINLRTIFILSFIVE